jgi:hypothetical protein
MANPHISRIVQSNGISVIEQIHLDIGNILRAIQNDKNNDLPPMMPLWSFISEASWAIHE